MIKKKLGPKARPSSPVRRESRAREVVSNVVRRSYVGSRCWSWYCRIELRPRVRIPVPRAFTRRDP